VPFEQYSVEVLLAPVQKVGLFELLLEATLLLLIATLELDGGLLQSLTRVPEAQLSAVGMSQQIPSP
jgi:hypothetical protein